MTTGRIKYVFLRNRYTRAEDSCCRELSMSSRAIGRPEQRTVVAGNRGLTYVADLHALLIESDEKNFTAAQKKNIHT